MLLFVVLFSVFSVVYGIYGKKPLKKRMLKFAAKKEWEKFNDLMLRYKKLYFADFELRWLNFIAKSETCDLQEIKEAAQENILANADNIEVLKVNLEDSNANHFLGFVWAKEIAQLPELSKMVQIQFGSKEQKHMHSVDLEILEGRLKDRIFQSYIASKMENEDCSVSALKNEQEYLGFFVVFNDLYAQILNS